MAYHILFIGPYKWASFLPFHIFFLAPRKRFTRCPIYIYFLTDIKICLLFAMLLKV
jgi:hypothetical protein